MAEVISRLPTKFISSAIVHIHSSDTCKHFPAPPLIFGFVVGNAPAHHQRRVNRQVREVVRQEWRGCTNYIFAKADCGRVLSGQQMCAHDIFDLDAPVEIFVYLNVIVRVGFPHSLVVVLFGEKARRSEHDAGKPLVPMEQLAKIFRCRLGHAIDVLGNRRDLLGHPGGRSSNRRHQGVTKDAGCAREDKRLDTCRHRLFQQIERASDVGVDEVLPAMSGDMRLVQSGRLEDCLDAAQTTPHARAVGYRADVSRKGRVNDVESDDLVF